MAAMFKLLSRVAAVALAIQTAHAEGAPPGGREAKEPPTEPARTGKERLGGKASDEQRLDNCKVPPEQRGPKARPDACGAAAREAGGR